MTQASRYWFHAKRYGWGWGAPATWQGWAVLAAYLVLAFAGRLWFSKTSPAYYGWIAVLSLIVLAICLVKGAPRRWRWGDED